MINTYHNLIPRILDCIKSFTISDGTKACEVMEILDNLVENAVTVIVPHTTLIVQTCLQLASTKTVDESVKIKAISFVGWLTKTKTKVHYECEILIC